MEILQVARLLASKSNRELFGATEFRVRDVVHRIGARALEATLEERKKGETAGYNAVSIVNATIAIEHSREDASMMSHFAMSREIMETTYGLLVALPASLLWEIATLPIGELVFELRTIFRGICLRTSRKSVRGPKKPPPQKVHDKRHVHVSITKLLAERKKTGC